LQFRRFETSLTREPRRVDVCPPTSHKKIKVEPASKALWFKNILKMDAVQQNNYIQCAAPPSENFKLWLQTLWCTFAELICMKDLPSRRELVRIGSETIIIPVPLQTYFMRNCSNITYHSLWEKIVFIWSTREPYALSRWLSSTCNSMWFHIHWINVWDVWG
jgi:hypothetical protein